MPEPRPINEAPRREILVIGKPELTDEESDLVQTLGFLIGLSGNVLHTTAAKGTAQAVAAGYRKSGLQAHTHRANLRNVDAHTIALVDEPFVHRLNKAYPGWADMDWDVLDNIEQLATYVSILATTLVVLRNINITGGASA